MALVKGNFQAVEEIYRLVWTAVANKRPISAHYKGQYRLFCPHRLGRNRFKQLRVLCYQFGGGSESGLAPLGGPENWRCIAVEKLQTVRLLEDAWQTAPHHSRPTTCVIDADIDADDQAVDKPQQGQ
jgi:hypothetical protein